MSIHALTDPVKTLEDAAVLFFVQPRLSTEESETRHIFAAFEQEAQVMSDSRTPGEVGRKSRGKQVMIDGLSSSWEGSSTWTEDPTITRIRRAASEIAEAQV